jgi:VIT1/CCC1 family predicted Fe2+/Mn2+ transporter
MSRGEERERAEITPESAAQPIKIAYLQRSTKVFQVFEHELDSLGSMSKSLNLTFAGVAFGAALTLLVTLTTVTSWNSPYMYATYVAVFVVSILALMVFGVRAGMDIRNANKEKKRIKEESPTATA